MIVRVVGAPGSGKSWLRARLAQALGLPSFGIDDERLTYGWSDAAWRSLSRKLRETAACIVETSGRHRNDVAICQGRRTFTVLCIASASVRRRRLAERVATGYALVDGQRDYVERLMKLGTPALHPHAVISTDRDATAQVNDLVERLRGLLGHATETDRPTAEA